MKVTFGSLKIGFSFIADTPQREYVKLSENTAKINQPPYLGTNIICTFYPNEIVSIE